MFGVWKPLLSLRRNLFSWACKCLDLILSVFTGPMVDALKWRRTSRDTFSEYIFFSLCITQQTRFTSPPNLQYGGNKELWQSAGRAVVLNANVPGQVHAEHVLEQDCPQVIVCRILAVSCLYIRLWSLCLRSVDFYIDASVHFFYLVYGCLPVFVRNLVYGLFETYLSVCWVSSTRSSVMQMRSKLMVKKKTECD